MIAMDDLRKQFTTGRGRQARSVVAVDADRAAVGRHEAHEHA